ncbi:hypothetical protein EKO27_g1064 [Xylaria grammica]|uniref:Uncharacterized protein n=1 Tax=Xylaria grammica TaxID=363999 RepID=A0A439DI18_9PEZI|nr:hypothetical protein EKO27_g1064 [Xylaria grammica]
MGDDRDYRYACCAYVDAPGFPPPPKSPKPPKSGAFSYDNKNGLRVGGFSRAPLDELKLLFRRNATSARRAVATKPWITAQLYLYGIAFNKSARVAELRNTLEAACVEGDPPSITATKEQLTMQFTQNRQDYARAVKKHKLDVDEWHKQNFSKLGDPSAEARYDLGWFLSKYFVDDQGLPAPNKTPEPIIVWDLGDRYESLRGRVNAIPGLRTQAMGFLNVIAWASEIKKGVTAAFNMIDKYPDLLVQEAWRPIEDDSWDCKRLCVVVGWAKQVIHQVESWKSRIAELEKLDAKRKERNKEKEILAKLKPHIDYARAHRPPPSGPFTTNQLTGSYIMHCRLLQDEYGGELGSMTLDIHAPTSTHGAMAAFDFTLVEGTMLLSSTEESLELLREENAACSSDEEEEPTDFEYFASLGKRKAKSPPKTAVKTFKRRLGSDRSQNPGRFYFQWAGHEHGTGELVLDEDHEKTGHFDLDKSGMTARGQFYYRGFFGDEPLVFTLLKVADRPRKQPGTWLSYREGAMWHHW